jgi:hypothetical protein
VVAVDFGNQGLIRIKVLKVLKMLKMLKKKRVLF